VPELVQPAAGPGVESAAGTAFLELVGTFEIGALLGTSEAGLTAGTLEVVKLVGTSGVGPLSRAGILEVQQFALEARICEVGLEAGISVELAVAAKVAAGAAAVVAAVEVEAVAAVAHGFSAVEADLHHID